MYYAAPYSDEDHGRMMIYIRKATIKEIGEYFKLRGCVNPQQEFIVYRGKPSNVKNYHAHYYFKNGNFVKKPMLLQQLLSDVFS